MSVLITTVSDYLSNVWEGGKLGESTTSIIKPAKALRFSSLADGQPIGAQGRDDAHAPPVRLNRFSVNAAVAPSSRSSNDLLPSFTCNYELFLNTF